MQEPRKAFSAELQHLRRVGAGGRGGYPGRPIGGRGDAAPSQAAVVGLAGPVEVDHGEVLAAIEKLSEKFDKYISAERTDVEQIQVEIADISGRIRTTKAEIASLRHPLSEEDRFQHASEQLSEVVEATEQATNKIIACVEELDDTINEIRAQLPEGYALNRVNDMGEVITRIFEACNFQDLTGQRITKVVRALTFIEERVDAMMSAWNMKEFETMPLPPSITKHDGELQLHGPRDHGNNGNNGDFSQSDIDALFD